MIKNDLYDYGLTIYQNPLFFKFSLDSILLAEFVKCKENERIVDLCTGNAPIPLILTTKYKNLNIDCVELQPEISDLAIRSIKENNLSGKIHIITSDIKELDMINYYDVVICNPPYYKVDSNALTNENRIKSIARHEIKISLEEIIQISNKLLTSNGRLYIVHKPNRLVDIFKYLTKNKFGIRKIVTIQTNEKIILILIEARKGMKSDPKMFNVDVTKLKSYKYIFERV